MPNKKKKDGVYTVFEPKDVKSPLVFDSPHSGRTYPKDFDYICDFQLLRRSEDLLVDELFAPLADKGYPFLTALFPRAYIDVNRHCRKIDEELIEVEEVPGKIKRVKEVNGTGLIRRFCSYTSPQPIYDRKLSLKDVFNRLSGYYYPYHDQLSEMLEKTQKRMGQYVYVSCHSLPSKFRDGNDNPYDIYLGTQDGESCDQRLTEALKKRLEEKGYSVAVNSFFKGGHNIRKYGVPAKGKHAILIEVNRGLYADEDNLRKGKNFDAFQKDILDIMTAFDRDARNILFNDPGYRPQRHKFFR